MALSLLIFLAVSTVHGDPDFGELADQFKIGVEIELTAKKLGNLIPYFEPLQIRDTDLKPEYMEEYLNSKEAYVALPDYLKEELKKGAKEGEDLWELAKKNWDKISIAKRRDAIIADPSHLHPIRIAQVMLDRQQGWQYQGKGEEVFRLKKDAPQFLKKFKWFLDGPALEFIHIVPTDNVNSFIEDVRQLAELAKIEEELFDSSKRERGRFTIHYHVSRPKRPGEVFTERIRRMNATMLLERLTTGNKRDYSPKSFHRFTPYVNTKGLLRVIDEDDQRVRVEFRWNEGDFIATLKKRLHLLWVSDEEAEKILVAEIQRMATPEILEEMIREDSFFLTSFINDLPPKQRMSLDDQILDLIDRKQDGISLFTTQNEPSATLQVGVAKRMKKDVFFIKKTLEKWEKLAPFSPEVLSVFQEMNAEGNSEVLKATAKKVLDFHEKAVARAGSGACAVSAAAFSAVAN